MIEQTVIRVAGLPVPKGNMRRQPHGFGMYDAGGDNLEAWMASISWGAREVWAQPSGAPKDMLLGPLVVSNTFWMPPPQRIPKVRDGQPAVPPDRDKLDRAVLDALTGIVYKDDGQVCGGTVWKFYATDGNPTGVMITILTAPDFQEVLGVVGR